MDYTKLTAKARGIYWLRETTGGKELDEPIPIRYGAAVIHK